MSDPIRSERPEGNDLPALYYRLIRQMEIPALLLFDPQGRIATWNRGCERLFGWEEAEVVGKLGRILFSPEEIQAGQFEKENLRATESGHTADTRWLIKKDGTRVFVTGALIALRDDDGKLLGFAKIMMDTTQTQIAPEHLAASFVTAQEDERRHIARELHDDLCQRLVILELGLTQLEDDPPATAEELRAELKKLRSYVGSAGEEVRRLSHRLHPSIVDDLGLQVALGALMKEFQAGRGQPIHFLCRNVPENIPSDVALVFYRIAQEALRNLAKHGGKGAVTVILTAVGSELCLSIEDAGPGFNLDAVRGQAGLGLKSMEERARLIGGIFAVKSEPGEGTTIEVRAPLHR